MAGTIHIFIELVMPEFIESGLKRCQHDEIIFGMKDLKHTMFFLVTELRRAKDSV